MNLNERGELNWFGFNYLCGAAAGKISHIFC